MEKHEDLKLMIYSEFFTIEMLIQYLIKFKEDKEVTQILVDRLRKYNKKEI